MNEDVLDRITDCAHYDKITDGERLQRETRWVWAAEDIEEILWIVRRFSPRTALAPLTISTPLQPRRQGAAEAASPTVAKPKRPVRCGACKQEGHTGESGLLLMCRLLTVHTARNARCPRRDISRHENDENMPPTSPTPDNNAVRVKASSNGTIFSHSPPPMLTQFALARTAEILPQIFYAT